MRKLDQVGYLSNFSWSVKAPSRVAIRTVFGSARVGTRCDVAAFSINLFTHRSDDHEHRNHDR